MDGLKQEGEDERAALRRRLLAAREAMPPPARATASAAITRALIAQLGDANPGVVAGYLPHRGEYECQPVLERVAALGGLVALPVPLRPRRAMIFRRWTPETPMAAGPGGILHPADGPSLTPDLVLVPLVGFDATGHRLGYGGGYYDRTLAALSPRPVTIGVAFELGRLGTLQPKPHDVALDWIVTEAGMARAA